MTRTCYDSINPAAIPQGVELVAGYIDGLYGPNHLALGSSVGWDAAGWARFPNTVHVRIACFSATNDGTIGDCETGDMTPTSCVSWVKMRRAAGVDPTIYMNASTWPTVRSAFQAAHVAEPHYWVADYDNIAVIPSPAIAKQYANATFTHANYDKSIVADFWPGVDINMTGDEVQAAIRIALASSNQAAAGNGQTAQNADVTTWYSYYLAHGSDLDVTMKAILPPGVPIGKAVVQDVDVTMDQVNAAIASAIAALPVPLSQADITAAVQAAVAALPPAPAPSLWSVLKNTVWPSN